MPLIDMPLAELLQYKGRNPCPPDFDEYWTRGIDDLKSVQPNVELVEYPLESRVAECFHLYFTGIGGARIHAKYLRPRGASVPHPALLMFHGYSGNSGDWADKLAYVSQGFSVAAMDCRGQGGLSEDSGAVKGNTHRGHIIRGLDHHPENLLYRQIFLDTVQLANVVKDMPLVDPNRIGATGASQGGALSLACAALFPQLKKAAPVYPFLCDYQRVWEMDLAAGAYEELRTYFRLFDPQHLREQEVFERLGYIDCQHLASRIQAEVLMPIGLMDGICPPSTQFAAYNRIKSKKNVLVYPDFGHENLPGCADHIFNFFRDL